MNESIGSKKQLSQFKVIQQFALSLLRQNSLDDLTWDIAKNAGQVLGFEDCIVYLREGETLVQAAAYGVKNPVARKILNPIQIPVGQGIVGTVAQTQVGEIVSDTKLDDRYIFDEFSGRSEIAVPIIYEGRTIGVLDSESSNVNQFTSDDFDLFQSVADIASSRIASAISERELRRSQRDLIKYQQELESKVDERTREIFEALKTLQVHESELRATQKELKQERDWLRSILNAISDGIIVTDSSGVISMVSDSATLILEKEACRIGSRIHEVLTIEGATIVDSEGNLIEGNAKGTLWTDSNAEKIIQCSVTSVQKQDPSELAFVISLQDITRQTFLEREAEKAQRLESLGVLAAGIAHDFNNQLAAVTGLVGAAKLSDKDTQIELLSLAEQACLRSKKLTDQLLAFSKGGGPKRQPTDIAKLANDAIMVAAAGSSTEFEVTVDADLPLVEADPGQILQVFENIIINAQQAMGNEGKIQVFIRRARLDGNAMVCAEIRDNGPGIEESHISRIFDPYFTTKDAGHGLGLTTSYSIVQRHHGQMVVESNAGKGASFSIFLPISKGTLAEELPSRNTVNVALEILLLEDEELVSAGVVAMLESLGHHVTATRSGRDAIYQLQQASETQKKFDLAILDMTVVGGMGGQLTMVELKSIDGNLPVISMSGYTAETVMGADRSGFDGYLQKPFSVDQLQEVIDDTLAGRM